MRTEVFADNFELSDVLRTYAESRVSVAVRRAADRLSWVGVRFRAEVREVNTSIACQLDVWVRGIGLLTVRHIDVNAYVAVDCAAVRLEQALVRKLRESGIQPARSEDARSAASQARPGEPRYAVVVTPADVQPRLSLLPWLRMRYGIEQFQTLSLSWPEWDALVAGEMQSPALERLNDRLALAQLGRPEALIVLGGAVARSFGDEQPQAQIEVERVVKNIRSLALPLEVIGVWINERWAADECLIESHELPISADRAMPPEREEEELYAGLTGD